MKNINKVLIAVLIVLLVAIAGLGVLLVSSMKEGQEEVKVPAEVIEVIEPEIEEEDDSVFSKKKWDANYEINSDYIGQLVFDSEIINEPIVQDAKDSYLRKNWITNEYDIQGTCYLDCRNSLSDDNLIIYGHYTEAGFTDYKGYDPDKRPMFSNLDLLLSEDNYEANRYLSLYLKDEVRRYEVVTVFYCPLDKDESTGQYVYVQDGYEYYLTSYTEESFAKYLKTIYRVQRYFTDADLDISDKLLTLQTCVAGREDLREIVLCRQIEVMTY